MEDTAPKWEWPQFPDGAKMMAFVWKEFYETWFETELIFFKNSYGTYAEPKSEILVDGIWYYKIVNCSVTLYKKGDILPGDSPNPECCFSIERSLTRTSTD